MLHTYVDIEAMRQCCQIVRIRRIEERVNDFDRVKVRINPIFRLISLRAFENMKIMLGYASSRNSRA